MLFTTNNCPNQFYREYQWAAKGNNAEEKLYKDTVQKK